MKFSIEVTDAQLRHAVADFAAITGINLWHERASMLKTESESNPFLAPHIEHRHRLELRFPDFAQLVRRRGLSTSDPQKYHDLISFVVGVSRLYNRLTSHAKKRLAGMLRDGLQDNNNGLLPLEHEINTLVHLLSQGYEVTPHDLEDGCGYDFLAKIDDAYLEIECKTVTADLGRMVPRRHVRMLYNRLKPVIDPLLSARSGGHFISIQLGDRLSASYTLHTEIAEAFSRAIVSGGDHSTFCSIRTTSFSFRDSPFSTGIPSYAEVRRFVETQFGKHNKELLFAGNSRSAFIICVEGEQPDQQFQRLLRNLKKAAKSQFTGRTPSCLVVSFLDLTQEELLNISTTDTKHIETANALQLIASILLDRRPHLIEVAYMTPDASYVNQRSGFSYYFPNTTHPLSGDKRYLPFNTAVTPQGD